MSLTETPLTVPVPKRHNYRAIVVRASPEETTFAVVTATTWGPDPLTDAEFIKVLKTAITEWAYTTGPGMSAWEASSEDFNVGDLDNEQYDPELIQILRVHGITYLSVTPHSMHDVNNHWTYDTVLVNRTPTGGPDVTAAGE